MLVVKGKNLEKKVVLALRDKIHSLLEVKERVVLGLVGGRSVSGIYEGLAKQDIDWPCVHIFPLDDRLVPSSSEESNSALIKKYFEKTKAKLHLFSLKESKRFGVEDLEKEFKKQGGLFDVIILSAGEDGHIAGLFPNKSVLLQGDFFIDFHDSPKPPKDRMSASRSLLEKSESAFLLFFGKAKQGAFKEFEKEGSVENIPARLCKSLPECFVFVDLE